MNLKDLEQFLKNNKVPGWAIVLFYIPTLFLIAEIIINTPQFPGVLSLSLAIYIIIIAPYYPRYIFYILFIIFNITGVFVTYNKYLGIAFSERLVQLFAFDIFLIIVIEIFISMLESKELIQQKLEEKTKLLSGIVFFISRSSEVKDIINEIPSVLQKIGEALKVNRTYIFKNGRDERGLYMSQIYEWTDGTVSSEINNDELQHLYYDIAGFSRWENVLSDKKIIAGLVANFPESERELLLEQSIIATMIVPIFVHDEFWGYIGLDECKNIRSWSKEVKEIMQTFADVIGSTIYTQKITSEIKSHSAELKKANDLMINRELRILELKNKIKQLKDKENESVIK